MRPHRPDADSDRLCQGGERAVHQACRIGIRRIRGLFPFAELPGVLDHHPAPLEAPRHEGVEHCRFGRSTCPVTLPAASQVMTEE
jgi:hypothetical protein